MKHIFLSFVLLSLTITTIAKEEEFLYLPYYEKVLDYRKLPYVEWREEAIDKLVYCDEEETKLMWELIDERDQGFLSTTTSFMDLWKLRYRGKWHESTLIIVADASLFYIQINREELKFGSSQEIGVIHTVMNALRKSEHPDSRKMLIRLIEELQTLKDERDKELTVIRNQEFKLEQYQQFKEKIHDELPEQMVGIGMTEMEENEENLSVEPRID
ncbi:MAG: hypothetical protein MI748_01565 [Opitutales bacterium]|nr:hypothetical protein [Opitutales bacterium]